MLRRMASLLLLICLLTVWGICEDEPVLDMDGELTPVPVRVLQKGQEPPVLGREGVLEVHFINVGAADCFLLRMDGKTLLIDAGNLETADVVLAYLDELGVKQLDYALLTHPHNDHIGGFVRIFEAFPVKQAIMPEGYDDFSSALYHELLAIIAREEIPVLSMQDGGTVLFGGASLVFCQWPDGTVVNDRSMLLHVALGDRAILFTADVENHAQVALAEMYGEQLRADILKMPHHGKAAYMREFHAAVQPELAIFTNAKHRIMEKNLTLLSQREVEYLVNTVGTLVAVTEGEGWTVWRVTE